MPINTADVIVVIILILIIGLACRFIYRQRKKGTKCIGCPYSQDCRGKCP